MRWKLTLSYAGFLLLAWAAFLIIMSFVLRFVPDDNLQVSGGGGGFVPNRTDLIRAGTPVAIAGTCALLVVGLAGGWFLAGRMLRPLQAISAAARATAEGSLGHRLAMAGPADEFRETADAFDSMLSRLEHAFDEQRRFTANASHELRTPFATIKTMLEVARAQGRDVDIETLIDRLQSMNNRSIATTEALLRLARTEGNGPTIDDCELRDIVRASLHTVQGEASRSTITIGTALAAAPVSGDGALLGVLVTNLLLNAIRHNNMSEGCVWVRCGRDAAGCSIVEVENTGAVLDPAVLATLTEPFVRGAGRVRSTNGPTGSGFGLSIASSVARTHHARLALRARPDGGLVAVVRFPRNEADLGG